MKRCFALLALAVAWCYGTSFAPVPIAARTTLYVPLLGVVASTIPTAQMHVPFVAWPLRAPVCTRETALAVLRSDVVVGGIAMGRAEAWSCTSLEEAQQELARRIASVQLTSWCWYHVGAALPLTTACPPRLQVVITAPERRP